MRDQDLFRSLFDLEDIFNLSTSHPEPRSRSLPCDVLLEMDQVSIKADLPPGCDKPVVKVENGSMKIEVTRPIPKEVKGTFERPYGKWTRTWELHDTHDPDSVEADIKDGVLTVTVKSLKSSKSRTVEIKV